MDRNAIALAAALALVVSMLPAGSAAHHVGPEDWTGLGPGDVSDEEDHPDDDTGLDVCHPSCTDPGGTLILDGNYAWGQWPYFLALNNVLEAATEAAGEDDRHEDRMYPGQGFLAAWWGWWYDRGDGGILNEGEGTEATPFHTGNADGAIQDGHDDHDGEDFEGEDGPYTGPWDEFRWRGVNPWADQSSWSPEGDLSSHPGDKMFAFIHPGTYGNCCSGLEKEPAGGKEDGNQFYGGPFVDTGLGVGPLSVGAQTPGLLLNTADDRRAPDLKLEDRTAQSASSPGPVPHNNIGYGWVEEVGYWHYEVDQSLMITTEITYAVNPKEDADGLYHLSGDKGPDYKDVDLFTSINDDVETLYRLTVWDPDDDRHQGNNIFADIIDNDEGPKQEVKDRYTATAHQASATVQQTFTTLTEPFNPLLGPADDLQGAKARPHEPDTGLEDIPAGHDPATAYGGIGDAYYRPGGNPYDPSDPNGAEAGGQTYEDYTAAREAWIDTQGHFAFPGYGGVVDVVFGMNTFPAPDAVTNDASERSAAPGLLYIDTRLGGWYDASGDTFIGHLDETGRTTSPDDPYASGRVDDPNDYSDTPAQQEADPTKDPSTAAEWKGADCDNTVTTHVRPVGTPTQGGQPAWGTTSPPVGVYLVKDEDNKRFNPYDDAAEDVADDGEVDRYIRYGEIPISYRCAAAGDDGYWDGQETILFPAGTAQYQVEIESTGDFSDSPLQDEIGGTQISGTVTDVDRFVTLQD